MGRIFEKRRCFADQYAEDQPYAGHYRHSRLSEDAGSKAIGLPIRLDAMDALGLALRAGSSKAVNLVLLGRLSRYFHFTDEQWQDAIEKSVPEKFLELNKKAFALGAEA